MKNISQRQVRAKDSLKQAKRFAKDHKDSSKVIFFKETNSQLLP